MFSALKRLAGKGEGSPGGGVTTVGPGLQTMSSSLQRKFARGVQYNMKIIIKGDRSVGKTCLFQRLQGHQFLEEYVPSDEIAVASIQWSYKATDDVVKVEVWDVVDKGKKRRVLDGLKLANGAEAMEEPALDAEFLDVYKGTNGVIIVMDITKAWTFEYVQRELPKVPSHIPVLVLANHCDMNHHRTVTADHVIFFVESLERQAPVRYTEGSMRNGFGLRYLHKFLNVPFLQLQRETLLAQLVTNEEETKLTLQELDMFQEKDEASYDKFLENLTNKRRQAAESTGVFGVLQPMTTRPPLPLDQTAIKMQPMNPQGSLDQAAMRKSMSLPSHMANTSVTSPSTPQSPLTPPSVSLSTSLSQTRATQSPPASTIKVSQTQAVNVTHQNDPGRIAEEMSRLDTSVVSVEEFIPDGGGLDHSFLEEPNPSSSFSPQLRLEEDTESEPEMQNPLVAGFQDDVDPDDIVINAGHPPSNLQPRLRDSVSSISSVEELKETPALNSSFLGEWGLPEKRRSSPEGREEGEGETTDHPLPLESQPELHRKKSTKEKGEKSKDKKKTKDKKKKQRSKKERDELEDFLNGSGSTPSGDAYEAL